MATDVFISHAAIDEELAAALKSHLQYCFSGLEVFVSSDPEDLQPGDLWIEKILEALKTARCVLAITTTRGLSRKWVWFESGRTWFNAAPLIPCCVGIIRKSQLPPPFSLLQALELDIANDVTALEKRLASILGTTARQGEPAAFAATMTRLDFRAEEKEKVKADPFAEEILAKIAKVVSTLSPAEQETVRHFVMFGQLTTSAARSYAVQAGVDMEKWSVPWALANKTGWLTQVAASKTNDAFEDSTYAINEQIRPHLKSFFSTSKGLQ
jgi:TIR domain